MRRVWVVLFALGAMFLASHDAYTDPIASTGGNAVGVLKAVPEPSSLIVLGSMSVGMAGYLLRRRRQYKL